MKFENICRKVYEYFEKNFNEVGLCSCIDVGKYYVFSAGDPMVTNYGGCMIMVDKKYNTIEIFDMLEDVKLLMQGKKVEIPEEYKF